MKLLTLLSVLYLFENIVTENLRILHYKNVTLRSCGLNAFSAKPPEKKCFEWHQSIIDEQKQLRNIQNGRYAENGEFPYVVLLKYRGDVMCTGSIINAYWILTSAHCIRDSSLHEIEILIYAGITDWPIGGYIRGELFIAHQNYSAKPKANDIALIKLDKQIKININQTNGICLPSNGMFMLNKQLASAIGWGAVRDNVSNNKRLKITPIKLVDDYYNDNEFIYSNEIKYGIVCSGDSGGPLIQYVNGKAVIIGISTSTNRDKDKKCGSITRMTFTAVPKYLNWIIKTIREN